MQAQTNPLSQPTQGLSQLHLGATDPASVLALLVSYFRSEARAETEAVWQTLMATRQYIENDEETKDVVSVREGAALLGVCVQTLYNLASKGIVKPYKLGGRTVYRRAELLSALKAQSRPDGTRRNARRGQKQKAR